MNEALTRTLDFLGWRSRIYKLAFPNATQNPVLRDLATYARMNEDCPHTDPFEIGKWLGRQEVVRRVYRQIHLTVEQQFDIYSGNRSPQLSKEENR